ncbi:MAG: DUF6446 family protein [Pseudomonadota bacterium]
MSALKSSGAWVVLAIAGVAAIGGAAIFYLQNFDHYRPVAGLTEIEIGGAPFAVSDYDGLDHEGWPLRLRGCFMLADPAAAMAAGQRVEGAEPFSAPDWFECWDAARIDADLKAGRAQAVIAETSGSGEFAQQRIVVIYADGRGYQWRRLVNPR